MVKVKKEKTYGLINSMTDNLYKMLQEYRVDFGNLSMSQL